MNNEADTWYSWVVVAVCFVVYFMNYGISRISGLIFTEIISYYNVDRQWAATPFLLASVARAISGPISGYLSHTFGFRFAIFLGCSLSSLGIFACCFAQDLNALCVYWTIYVWSNGLIVMIAAVGLGSVGVGTIFPTLLVLVDQYFEKEMQSMAMASADIFLLPMCFGTSPLIGYFRDDLGSYDGLAFTLSATSFVCSALVLLIPSISRWKNKRQENTLRY